MSLDWERLEFGYEPVRWVANNGIRTHYCVRRWPHLLKEIVRVALDRVEPVS